MTGHACPRKPVYLVINQGAVCQTRVLLKLAVAPSLVEVTIGDGHMIPKDVGRVGHRPKR